MKLISSQVTVDILLYLSTLLPTFEVASLVFDKLADNCKIGLVVLLWAIQELLHHTRIHDGSEIIQDFHHEDRVQSSFVYPFRVVQILESQTLDGFQKEFLRRLAFVQAARHSNLEVR